MGYRSAAKGSIEMSPAIDFAEAAASKFGDQDGDTSIMFQDWNVYDDTMFIIPRWDDEFKAYWIVDELIEIVEKWGEGRTFSGFIEIQGEGHEIGSIDLWRLRVKDGTVEQVVPKLTWPEDD